MKEEKVEDGTGRKNYIMPLLETVRCHHVITFYICLFCVRHVSV